MHDIGPSQAAGRLDDARRLSVSEIRMASQIEPPLRVSLQAVGAGATQIQRPTNRFCRANSANLDVPVGNFRDSCLENEYRPLRSNGVERR